MKTCVTMFPTVKTAILAPVIAAVLGASALTSAPALAGQKHYTCTGLRSCDNFVIACQRGGGDHSVDTPSTPSGGPIVHHCRVNEARIGAIRDLRAAAGREQKLRSR